MDIDVAKLNGWKHKIEIDKGVECLYKWYMQL